MELAIDPIEPSLLALTIIGLVLLRSVVGAFAETIADPVQVWLGTHRRRWIRLRDTLDAEINGLSEKPFVR